MARNIPVRMEYREDWVIGGEDGLVITSRYGWKKNASKPPLILCHGANGSPESVWQEEGNREMCHELAKDFLVYVGDIGGPYTWANDTAILRVAQIKSWLASTFGHNSVADVGLIGQSMGGGVAMAFALEFQSAVKFIAAQIPMISIQDVYNIRPDLQDSIDAAYGGNYQDLVDGNTHSPIRMFSGGVSTLPDIPIKIWASSNDTVVRPGPLASFLEFRPQTMHVDVGLGGHSQASIDVAVPDTIDFCRSFLPEMMESL